VSPQSFTTQAGIYFLGLGTLTRLFDMDYEESFPTLYNLILLLLGSLLLWAVFAIKRRAADLYTRHWLGLAAIFFYLAVDEGAVIHEPAGYMLREAFDLSGVLYFAWVVPASLLLLIFTAVYLGFVLHLPAKTKRLFVAAGLLYVGGALGVELFEGYHYELYGDDIVYGLAVILEESLEMFGLVLFIYALLDHLRSYVQAISFSLVEEQDEVFASIHTGKTPSYANSPER